MPWQRWKAWLYCQIRVHSNHKSQYNTLELMINLEWIQLLLSSSPALWDMLCMNMVFAIFKSQVLVPFSQKFQKIHPQMLAVRISWANILKLVTLLGSWNGCSKGKKDIECYNSIMREWIFFPIHLFTERNFWKNEAVKST